jgi:hypothetical protein
MQMLEKVEFAMKDGTWEESATLIAKAQLLFDQGEANEKERRRATQLSERVQLELEKSHARDRGLEALEAGEIMSRCHERVGGLNAEMTGWNSCSSSIYPRFV